jgi:RNA polymerase sigma-70 factor (ECF subfamily)
MYAPKMFSVCLRYMQRQDLAEDVLQEGFIKVFMNLHTYNGSGDFEGWMRRIFVNMSLEILRRDKKINNWEDLDDFQGIPTSEGTASAIGMMSLSEIMQAISNLPDGLREVLNLYIIDGYAHKEIADMLGISEANSKQRLSRARSMLQQVIFEMNKVQQ